MLGKRRCRSRRRQVRLPLLISAATSSARADTSLGRPQVSLAVVGATGALVGALSSATGVSGRSGVTIAVSGRSCRENGPSRQEQNLKGESYPRRSAAVTQEKQDTRDPLDQQQLPPQGKPRTAVVVIVIIVLLIVIAFFIGSTFSKPGRGFFLIPGAAGHALPPP
jgi:hypothetical protein